MSVFTTYVLSELFKCRFIGSNYYYPLNVSDDFGIGIVKVGSNEVCLSNYI